MAGIKSLAKDTAVYGLSSIIGRFLNWCLVPLYVYLFPTNEYGIVSYLYSFTAVTLVILNYGMETGFFRFANKEGYDSRKVYTTALWSIATTSLAFIVLLTIFLQPVSDVMTLPLHPEYVWLLGVTVAIDAFTNLPFSYLRFKKRPYRFAALKLANIAINISLNLFLLLACPRIMQTAPQTISWFYAPLGGEAFGIGWIFISNFISTLCMLLLLLPEVCGGRWRFDTRLLRSMLGYSWPLLILGIAGILSQNMGQIIIPYLFEGNELAARSMVGIYGANIKIAIVMVMFTQAFRYAYEPFIFSRTSRDEEGQRKGFCDAMKYFVIFGLFIFLAVMFYMPILKHFIAPAYWQGLRVVPLMMLAELCFGVYFNLSIWYKLTDRTQWGMWLSLICFALMFVLNMVLVPAIGIPDGYLGSAWAALISYFAVMVISYFLGRRYMPLPYDIKSMGGYTLLALALWFIGERWLSFGSQHWLLYLTRTLLLMAYAGMVGRGLFKKHRLKS